jgi:ubiquinone/menaquinone biosynthesis C-methylase UbiE
MREWDKKRRIMRRYDLTAHIYDMRYSEEQKAKIKAALEAVSIKKGSLVLDAGCGTGLLFGHLPEEARLVVGLDISRKTLLEAKARAKRLPNAALVWADADCMPFKKATFDYVFAFTLLQNLPNPPKTLSEMKRVARESASFVVTGMKKAFSKKRFEELLLSSGLSIVALREKGLKCYVAICRRSPARNTTQLRQSCARYTV